MASLLGRSIERLRGISGQKRPPPIPWGDGDESGTATGTDLSPWRRQGGFQLRHALFELLDPGAGARQYLGLDVEFLSGNQLETAQSLRQDIVKIGAQILVRVYHPWRNQRDKS